MEQPLLFKSLAVVYVEDDDDMRESVARLLRRRVGSLYLAANGREGLNMVRDHHTDMVITDLEMPVMNGLEMIRLIRAEFSEHMPIIVITAYKDEEHRTPLADYYVYKPLDSRELFKIMAHLSPPTE
jgi:CheY-like chemotaxis protein